MQNLETNVMEKSARMDTLMRKELITFIEMDAKSETSNLNNLSVKRKKTLVENVTGKSFHSITYICDLWVRICLLVKGDVIWQSIYFVLSTTKAFKS